MISSFFWFTWAATKDKLVIHIVLFYRLIFIFINHLNFCTVLRYYFYYIFWVQKSLYMSHHLHTAEHVNRPKWFCENIQPNTDTQYWPMAAKGWLCVPDRLNASIGVCRGSTVSIFNYSLLNVYLIPVWIFFKLNIAKLLWNHSGFHN